MALLGTELLCNHQQGSYLRRNSHWGEWVFWEGM